MPSNFIFELLCVDPEDIHHQQGFVQAISFSKNIWNSHSPLITQDASGNYFIKGYDGLTINVIAVDTSKIFTDLVEAAFVLRVESKLFEPLEPIRSRILQHLNYTLKFRYLRILQDDISAEIANQLYPQINAVENLLRRYLIKFFFQRVGMNWWEVTATPKMIDKAKNRQRNRSNQFSSFIKPDVEFADFDEIGQLIYKQSTGFNDPEKVLERLQEIQSIEELNELKAGIAGNYTKYFKKYFQDKEFEKLWKEMSKIRNKVAHQATFNHSELMRGKELGRLLSAIIREAETHIDSMVLSLTEKQAIHEAAVEAVREQKAVAEAVQEAEAPARGERAPVNLPREEQEHRPISAKNDLDLRVKVTGPKVVGTIKLDHKVNTYSKTQTTGFNVITESEIMNLLEVAEQENYVDYVGLKWFVTQYLANKGFSISTTYSLVNILIDQGLIDLYNYQSNDGYDIKAVRLPRGSK